MFFRFIASLVAVGCCLSISSLSPAPVFKGEALASPATSAPQPASGTSAAPAASPTASAAALVFEPTVKSLDAIWAARHEVHPQILEFLKKKQALQDNYEVLWRMSRLSYYGGFFALPKDASSEDKMAVFLVGSEAGDKARKLEPSRVEGHYWYAVTLGGWGIAKGIIKALSSATPMRDALTEAIKIDPKYHHAGPYRIRGRLYNKIPGLISFGDNQKAADDLRKAISLAPESKLNHVYMAEVQAKIQSKAEALKTLEYARSLPDVVGVAEEAAYRKDISELENKFR
ncbi:MAG: hypothetical protein FJY29_06160 [Betaproteobacteria bacterium]|nr:hypothetical protein [Betaproteobacteria bacterium]